MTTRQFIVDVLAKAQEAGRRDPVAQHLVGAMLQLRFPDVEVRNESFSADDAPSDQAGDFLVGDTAFHVTVAPTVRQYEKCKQNLRDGLRVFLLVTEDRLAGTRQIVEIEAPGRIAVNSVEAFVAQSIEGMSEFVGRRVTAELHRLLDIYNERVDAVERDKSLMIEIPSNLGKYTV